MILWTKTKQEKGQVLPFMVLLVAVLLLAIAASTIIGEVAFSRIRLANMSDGALISASSAFCRALNQIRQISIGSGGLLVTYIGLQTFLLSHIWPYKGAPLATGFFINSMLTSQRLFEQAERVAKNAPKDFRMGLYDQVFGGALIDEPKPFIEIPGGNARRMLPTDPADPNYLDCNATTGPLPLDCNEIERGPNGRVTFINYNKYLNRDSNFSRLWRDYKKANASGSTAWYWKNLFAYYYNKTKAGVIPAGTRLGQTSGRLVKEGGTPPTGYDSHLQVQFQGMPTSVDVNAQWMIMIYFYWVCKHGVCVVMPGFVPHPWAWISSVDIDSTNFRLTADKLSSFSGIPFFPRSNVAAEHQTCINVRGSVWSGYEFRMERCSP